MRGRYLPELLTGDSVFAVTIDEGAKHRPERIGQGREKSGSNCKLSAGTP
jgi:hypothetical protein